MTDSDASANPDRPAPRSPGELFVTFTLLALQGFGGVLAVAHRTLVERKRWLTREEFVELLSLSQLLPGANIVNMSLIVGDRAFGWRGALAALSGMMVVPLIVMLSLVAVYNQFADQPVVAGALRGMAAVAAGLTLGMGIRLAVSLRGNPLGWALAGALGVATFVLIAVVRAPLVWVVPGLGLIGWALARWRLSRREGA